MATSVTLKPNAIDISGSTSGTTTLQASAVAGTTTLTLPAATDTLVGKATTDTLTNKTLTGAAMNGTLGATTPSTASVTTLTTSSTVTHSGGTANGVAYLDGSKVLTTGSALTYDGTNLGVGSASLSSASGRVDVTINGTSSSIVSLGTGGTRRGYMIHDGTDLTLANEQAAGALRFVTSAGESMRIATATGGVGAVGIGYSSLTSVGNNGLAVLGNVGIGTSSPAAKLHIGVASAAVDGTKGVRITNPAGTIVMLECGNGGDSFVGTTSGSDFNIRTNNITRATFDNAGNLLVGTTDSSPSAGNGVKLQKNRSGLSEYNAVSVVSNANNAGYSSYELYTSTGTTGYKFYVLYNGGISNFSANNVNLSDRREKTDFEPAGNYLAKICAIPVQTFNYINQGEDDQGKTLGVVAQDVQAVAPELVTETKLGTDGEGETRLAIYQTDLQYALMKCIQEMKAIIDTQASTITQLQADVAALKGA